jgi:hypothetical protein
VERQVKRWTHQYRASQTRPIEAMESLIEWVPRHPAKDYGSPRHGRARWGAVHAWRPRCGLGLSHDNLENSTTRYSGAQADWIWRLWAFHTKTSA